MCVRIVRSVTFEVIHTVRISNVDSFVFVNIIREMINFELGKVIERVVFLCETSH